MYYVNNPLFIQYSIVYFICKYNFILKLKDRQQGKGKVHAFHVLHTITLKAKLYVYNFYAKRNFYDDRNIIMIISLHYKYTNSNNVILYTLAVEYCTWQSVGSRKPWNGKMGRSETGNTPCMTLLCLAWNHNTLIINQC